MLSLSMYCVDINECDSDDTNDCNQICSNTAGSYLCYCNTGYELELDDATCVGRHVYCTVIDILNLLQILMNVALVIMEDVHKIVQILLEVILVHVMLDMQLILIVMLVMVSQSLYSKCYCISKQTSMNVLLTPMIVNTLVLILLAAIGVTAMLDIYWITVEVIALVRSIY